MAELEMPRAQRIMVVAVTAAVLVAAIAVIPLMLWRLLTTRGESSYEEFRGAALYLIGASGAIIVALHIARTTRVTGWYSARFSVTSEGIERTLRGRRDLGKWTDLANVSPRRRTLYFADGTTIPMMYGPGLDGVIKEHDLNTVIAASGDDSLLAQSFREYESARPSSSQVVFAVVASLICGITTWIVIPTVFRETLPPQAIVDAAGASILIVAAISFSLAFKRQRDVDNKYRPH